MNSIQMVDLAGQYRRIKSEIDAAILKVVGDCAYVHGPEVAHFERSMADYLNVKHVIACANGTDALQIALMALGLEAGDEVIVPAFTYVATAEVIALLGLRPVMVDVGPGTFNIRADLIRPAISSRTKAIVPVHLFGQACDMDPIAELAREFDLAVVEDNAQAIGSQYHGAGRSYMTGTLSNIGCTSFFPSKNLGCFGDGGAMFTDDDALAASARMIGNHGQAKKYYHSRIGVNSRLDTIQAAVLRVKLRYLDEYCAARKEVAARYDAALEGLPGLSVPEREPSSTHVFHQYTLRVADGRRDALKAHLHEKGVPSMIYYPLPLYEQEAFRAFVPENFKLPVTEDLCRTVLSLPIHTEMDSETQDNIIESVRDFFAKADRI